LFDGAFRFWGSSPVQSSISGNRFRDGKMFSFWRRANSSTSKRFRLLRSLIETIRRWTNGFVTFCSKKQNILCTVFSSDRKVLFQSIKTNKKPLLSNSFASVLKSKVLCKRGQVNR
jgi:hypothetical protein